MEAKKADKITAILIVKKTFVYSQADITIEKLSEIISYILGELAELKKGGAATAQQNAGIDATQEYYTRHELANTMHVSLATLDTYAKDGKIQKYYFGRRVLFKKSEIEAAINNLKPTKKSA